MREDRFTFSKDLAIDPATGWSVLSLRRQHVDPRRDLAIRIVPAAGSNLFSIKAGNLELLAQPPELYLLPTLRYGMPILYPTPGRVRNGKFSFDGHDYTFPTPKGPHSIHGFAHYHEWQFDLCSSDQDHATVRTWLDWNRHISNYPLFPIDHRIELTYTLDATAITIDVLIENKGDNPLPCGFGLHPYFNSLGDRSNAFVRVLADKLLLLTEDRLPTGELKSVAGTDEDLRHGVSLEKLSLDSVYSELQHPEVCNYQCLEQKLNVSLSASKEFTHLVVFTPPGQPFFCLENLTSSPDAHNLFSRGSREAAHLLVIMKEAPFRGQVQLTCSLG